MEVAKLGFDVLKEMESQLDLDLAKLDFIEFDLLVGVHKARMSSHSIFNWINYCSIAKHDIKL